MSTIDKQKCILEYLFKNNDNLLIPKKNIFTLNIPSIFDNFKFNKIKTKEDYLLWLQLSNSNYKFIGIKKILSSWRVNKNSLSNNIIQKVSDSFRIYYQFEKQNFLKTIFSIVVLSLLAFKKNRFLKL